MSKRKHGFKSFIKERNSKLPVNSGRKFSNVPDDSPIGFVVMDRGNLIRPATIYKSERKAEEFAFFQQMEKHRQCSVVRVTYQRKGSDWVIFGPKSKLYSGAVQFL